MEPRIQYAKTSDGVSIAYAVLGSGPAIVFPSDIFGSVHTYQHTAATRVHQIFDGLTSFGWSVVTYDARGTGSSDRDAKDYGLEARLADLVAVVDRVALEQFALFGIAQGGPVAIAYASRHSDRVTHLILSSTYANGMDWYVLAPAMRIAGDMLGLAENEWEFYTLSVANAVIEYRDSQQAFRLAETFRAGMKATDYVAFVEATKGVDVSDLLPQIQLPTLVVVTTRGFTKRFGPVTKRLVPLIPNARLVETDDHARVCASSARAETPQLRSPMFAVIRSALRTWFFGTAASGRWG